VAIRLGRNAATKIARALDVNRSTVSRVARGLKTSERVTRAIIRYLAKHSNGAR
jgi:DNA-binding IclR family transcriptional regulator